MGALTSAYATWWWVSVDSRNRVGTGTHEQGGVLTDPEPILHAAQRLGAQRAEAFIVQSEETPVRFEANRLKEINARQTSGVALRVIVNGRIGFASSTKPM